MRLQVSYSPMITASTERVVLPSPLGVRRNLDDLQESFASLTNSPDDAWEEIFQMLPRNREER